MNNLLRIETRPLSGHPVQTVNARELHAALEVGKDFSNWIKAQVERARLREGDDFVKVAQKGELGAMGQTRIDYHLTLDAAKHVAMMSGTERGFEVRDYFIECERIARAQPVVDPIAVLNDPAAMRGLLLTYTEKVLALQAVVAEQQPKVESFERLMGAKGTLCLRDAAKALSIQPIKLNRWMQEHKWIYRRTGHNTLTGYQDKIQAGLLHHKVAEVRTLSDLGDEPRIVEQVRVTGKGLCKLAMLLNITLTQAA